MNHFNGISRCKTTKFKLVLGLSASVLDIGKKTTKKLIKKTTVYNLNELECKT